MTLIPTSLASAIPDRAEILTTLETLVIGAAGGLLFLWAGLPGGLISGAMFAVGNNDVLAITQDTRQAWRLTGFSRKSRAPARMARAAVGTSP